MRGKRQTYEIRCLRKGPSVIILAVINAYRSNTDEDLNVS